MSGLFPKLETPVVIQPTREDLLTLPVLSIREPWLHAIYWLGKDVENRSWKTNTRGDILLHGGQRFDKPGERFLIDHFGISPSRQKQKRGQIVGKVNLVDCCEYKPGDELENGWIAGTEYYFKFAEKRIFETPIPISGRLLFFRIKSQELQGLNIE